MEIQALVENEIRYPDSYHFKIDTNIHKVNEDVEEGMRTFAKLSFSHDKYDFRR